MPLPNLDLQQLVQGDPELRDTIANTTSSDPDQAITQVSDIEHKKVTQVIDRATSELTSNLPSLPVTPPVPQLPKPTDLASSGIDRLKSLLPNPANFIVIPTFFGSDIVAGVASEAVKKATDTATKAATKAGELAKEASAKSEARIQKASRILNTAELQGQINELRGTVQNNSGASNQ